ncbi:MAG: T9SS type A sorting domain-containing protein [Bacteroidota bacterium]
MRKFIFYLSIGISSTTAAQTTNHGIDANWYQAPKAAATISGPISAMNNVQGAVANNMLVKQNGTVILFYKQVAQNKWTQSSDGGVTWTNPGSLPVAAVNGLSTISADIDQNDNIYIVWKSGNYSLGFSKYNGTSWSPTYTINTQTQNAGDTITFSQITVDRKNRIHIMWQQGNHLNYSGGFYSTCWYARSTDGGNTFTTMQLSQNTTNYRHAAFPVADFGGTAHDTLMIAWRENTNGGNHVSNWNWDVKARITYDGGATWNPAFTLEGSANPSDDDQWDPNIIVDKNGIIHAFYHIYHNATIPDYNANVMYEYSLNGGNTWSTPVQISTTNIRSHLIKTAYDYNNNYVWCTWKDEIDFGNIPNNAQADIKAVYIQNTGTPVISTQEFITDQGSSEVAYHNFKVGNDGIMRATYNIAKINDGKGDTIFYTQRNALITGLTENHTKGYFTLYPNPTTDYFNINSNEVELGEGIEIKIYNALGELIMARKNDVSPINLPAPGIYMVEITNGKNRWYQKVIRH